MNIIDSTYYPEIPLPFTHSEPLEDQTEKKTQTIFERARESLKNCLTSIQKSYSNVKRYVHIFYQYPELIIPYLYRSIFGDPKAPPPSRYGSVDGEFEGMSFDSRRNSRDLSKELDSI